MPRTVRAIVGGYCYHLINRGNNRARVFHDAQDYRAFLSLVRDADERVRLDILAMCLMPNHYHLVVRPQRDDDISKWAQGLFTRHVRRHHLRNQTSGRVWQGRFKPFVIQQDAHLLTVLRYVERNALRAGLVNRAEDWEWGSLNWRMTGASPIRLTPPPVPLPSNWRLRVNTPQSEAELQAIRTCVTRQRPFGAEPWVEHTARELGIECSLHPVGRPAKRAQAPEPSRESTP